MIRHTDAKDNSVGESWKVEQDDPCKKLLSYCAQSFYEHSSKGMYPLDRVSDLDSPE